MAINDMVSSAQVVWQSTGVNKTVPVQLNGTALPVTVAPHGVQGGSGQALFDWSAYKDCALCKKCLKEVVPFEMMNTLACICSLKAQIAKAKAIVDQIEKLSVQQAITELLAIAAAGAATIAGAQCHG